MLAVLTSSALLLTTSAAGAEAPPEAGASPAGECADEADVPRDSVHGERFMVSTAHPMATHVGCEVLRDGGTAADAVVAVQAVLTIVEPQSSGLGGGSQIAYWDAQTRETEFFEGLAESPDAVTPGLEIPTEHEKQEHGVDEFGSDVNYTGRAAGIPGTVHVLDRLHDAHGEHPWASLFEDAARIGAEGFEVSPYLHDMLEDACDYPDLRARYCDGDTPKPAGATVRNADAAGALREVAAGGAAAFYDPTGTIAPAMVERARAGPFKPESDEGGPANIPSLITTKDFAEYASNQREPLCGNVFGHRLCTAPPPAFGGVGLLNLLSLGERAGVDDQDPGTVDQAHLLLESSRLSGVDARSFVGDPDFAEIPVEGLRDPEYLDERAAEISPDEALHPVRPGGPDGNSDGSGNNDATSHVSIVDEDGNAASMTTTVNLGFGARMEARGIVLNDAQSNFASAGTDSVNSMAPSKRPRTSTAPSLLFDGDGQLRLVTGAAGGGPIPDYVAQSVLGATSYGMDPQEALDRPHVSGQTSSGECSGREDVRSDVEEGTDAVELLPRLVDKGHPCAEATELRSGATAIEVVENGLYGAADRRRDGEALGD